MLPAQPAAGPVTQPAAPDATGTPGAAAVTCGKVGCTVPPTVTVTGRCLGCRTLLPQAVCEEHRAELTGGMLLGFVRSHCCYQPCTLVGIEAL